VMGRATQGVKLINLKKNDQIASVAKVEHEEDADVEEVLQPNDDIEINPDVEDTEENDTEDAGNSEDTENE